MAIKRFSGDRFSGLSTDTKPINILSGAFFTETDTGKNFVYNGATWEPAGGTVSTNNTLSGDGSSSSPLGVSINTMTSLGTTVASTDLLAIYDSSAGNHKEISISELQITESQISNLGPYDNYQSWELKVEGEAIGSDILAGEFVDFVGTGATTITRAGNVVTIDSNDTNTTYAAGDGVELVGNTFNVDLATNSALEFITGELSVASTIAGANLTWNNGVIDAPAPYSHPTGFTDAPGTALTGDTVISQIDVTSEGHVNGVVTRELNYDNYGSWGLQVNTGAIAEIGSGDDVDLIGSGATSISRTGNAVTISSTDTTYTAGDGLTLSAGEFSAHLAANANAATVDLDDATSNGLVVQIPNATTTTAGVISGADQQKVDYLTVTAATDLDAIRSRVNELDASVVLSGTWDASLGSFPSATNKGESFIVSTGGTVDGIEFVANDRIVALVDSPSTTTYASNWHKLDYTDAVLSVDGQTGAVTLDYIDSVTAGTGLTGGGSSGAVTVNFDISSLNDNAAALVGADELAIYDASLGTNKRANFSEIPLSILNDDLGVVTGAAGANHQIQFNNAGSFGADSNFLWDDGNQNFSVTGGRTLSEGGTIVSPATHGEVYDYVTTEVVGSDTITRYMSRLGNGDDVIVASYIQTT